ncbi:MAG: hypothetical protein HQL50_11775 [Magnetococcales bacterium]|nr:hypothetical protein [Magnetococcales bacterium]
MTKHQVTLSRNVTVSAVMDVYADDEYQARQEAILQAWGQGDSDLDWSVDPTDWNQAEPYIIRIVEVA